MLLEQLSSPLADTESLVLDFDYVLMIFNDSDTFQLQNGALESIFDLAQYFDKQLLQAELWYFQYTDDPSYARQQEELHQLQQKFQQLQQQFYHSLLHSPFKQQLRAFWGETLFQKAEAYLWFSSANTLVDRIRKSLE